MPPTLPQEFSYIDNALKRAKLKEQQRGGGLKQRNDALVQKILKIYGSLPAYTQFKSALGVSAEHAARFEQYGVVLQPKQWEFALWARRADDPTSVREVGLGGARGPGKSFAIFAVVCLDDCQRFPGLKVLYLRKTGKAAKEQLADLVTHVLGQFPDAEVLNDRIRFQNGSTVVIGGFKDDAEAQTYQGVEYDVVVIEEATQLTGTTYKMLRLSERSSKVYNGTAWQPRTYVSMNPLGVGHKFFKERFVDPERQGRGGVERKFIFGRVTDNVFVNPGYIHNLEELVGVYRRAYLEGDWDVSAGAFFETWRYEVHVIPPLGQDVSWLSSVWASMDFGHKHWNMTYLHGLDGDGTTYTFHELANRKAYPKDIAPLIYEMLAWYRLSLDDLDGFLVGADVFHKTGVAEQTVAEQYANLGIYMTSAETRPGSRAAGARQMAQLLGDPDRKPTPVPPSWYVTRNCERLWNCLPYLEIDPNNNEDVKKINANEEGEGGDDPFDGARYGLYIPARSQIG